MALLRTRRQGRPPHQPKRDTLAFARLQQIFSGWGGKSERPIAKAVPSNLRRFSRSVYVRRGIRIIKEAVAGSEWAVGPKKDVELNSELQRQIDLTTACLNQPNIEDSWRSFIEQISEDIQVCGAGAFEHQLGGDALRPLWMWPVDALSIQVNPFWNGDNAQPRYWQSWGYGNIGWQQGTPIYNDEFAYIKSDPSTETPFGLGWVEVAFNTINRILATADAAGNIAGNATPLNLLWFKDLEQEQLEAYRVYWQNEIEGQVKVPIVGGEAAEVMQLRGNDDKALFLGYQEFLVRELACASGLSPMNFAIERDVNRDTAEVSEDRDWAQTIVPHASLITSYINRHIIEGRLGFSQIELKILSLDREDELDAAKIEQMHWLSNTATVDEIRARRGEPPIEGQWGPMTKADMDIAISAARGSAKVDDDELPDKPSDKQPKPAAKTSPKKKPKGK